MPKVRGWQCLRCGTHVKYSITGNWYYDITDHNPNVYPTCRSCMIWVQRNNDA